jgi:hypothetical protein
MRLPAPHHVANDIRKPESHRPSNLHDHSTRHHSKKKCRCGSLEKKMLEERLDILRGVVWITNRCARNDCIQINTRSYPCLSSPSGWVAQRTNQPSMLCNSNWLVVMSCAFSNCSSLTWKIRTRCPEETDRAGLGCDHGQCSRHSDSNCTTDEIDDESAGNLAERDARAAVDDVGFEDARLDIRADEAVAETIVGGSLGSRVFVFAHRSILSRAVGAIASGARVAAS